MNYFWFSQKFTPNIVDIVRRLVVDRLVDGV